MPPPAEHVRRRRERVELVAATLTAAAVGHTVFQLLRWLGVQQDTAILVSGGAALWALFKTAELVARSYYHEDSEAALVRRIEELERRNMELSDKCLFLEAKAERAKK